MAPGAATHSGEIRGTNFSVVEKINGISSLGPFLTRNPIKMKNKIKNNFEIFFFDLKKNFNNFYFVFKKKK